MKNNNIPQYLLCSTPELAKQVLEKIERESDLRWRTGEKPSRYFPDCKLDGPDYWPIKIDTRRDISIFGSTHLEYSGITNFTKAEDYLNNNYMTDKTWENLEVNDVLIDEVDREVLVLAIVGRIIFISEPDNFDESNCYYTSKELVEIGYKIKGDSEDKPSIDDVIEILDKAHYHACDSDAQEAIMPAIEMLKKLK